MYQLYNIKSGKIDNVPKKDVLDKIYFLEYRLPTGDEINKYLKVTNGANTVEIIKKEISKIEDKVPLYDAYTENIYLIGKHNVYDRVVHQSYRFPEQELISELIEKKNMQSDDKISDDLVKRKNKKLTLMINFMNNFDIDTLYDTYVKVFYKYSEFVGKETTICKNPSFQPQFTHIKPYMTRSEIINMSLNLGMNIPDVYLEQKEITELCKKIKKYQINYITLQNHQTHIIGGGNLGLVQYYTLQGSYFMNQYLRNMTMYKTKNEYLENMISPMWNIVLTAPEFDQPYILYRFIQEDSFLKDISVGDIYTENGFMSTTRDPFYRSDLYKFGFILIKIKVPPNKKGIALCLEAVSHFPEEQEVIFPPKSKFKLISRDNDCIYYHTDQRFSSKVKTRYEFEWINNDSIKFDRTKQSEQKKLVDFLTIIKPKVSTLAEKINYFTENYVDNMGQFSVNLNNTNFTIMSETYDSTSIYKNFYGLETKNGYSMYTMHKGHMLFFVEIGSTNEGNQLHINYYVKYSAVDPNIVVGDENMINFFSAVAYYFDAPLAVIYANYLNCNPITVNQQFGGAVRRTFSEHKIKNNKNVPTQELINGSYCIDFFNYIASGKKKYADIGVLNVELQPKFSYRDLDKLKRISPSLMLLKEDRDEIYQLYDKIFKQTMKNDTVADFYIWLKENKCYLIEQFVAKLDRLIEITNPFRNDVYILDPLTYLYNRSLIKTYPTYINIDPKIKRNIIREDTLNNVRQKQYMPRQNNF